MVRLLSSDNPFYIQQSKDLLDSHGIPCFIKNQFAQGAVGELAPLDCWPELWLADDEWLPKAQQLIGDLAPVSAPTQWQCQQCNETIDAELSICWNCQQSR